MLDPMLVPRQSWPRLPSADSCSVGAIGQPNLEDFPTTLDGMEWGGLEPKHRLKPFKSLWELMCLLHCTGGAIHLKTTVVECDPERQLLTGTAACHYGRPWNGQITRLKPLMLSIRLLQGRMRWGLLSEWRLIPSADGEWVPYVGSAKQASP